MKAAFDDAAVGQIEFDGICRVAACRTQRQQGLQGLFDIVRHAVQIHVVAQNFIEIGHGKQDFPIGHPRTVRRGRADAVHAFGKFLALMEMVHAGAVFLTKRNLPLVLQLGENIVPQGGKFGRAGKLRQCFGMRFGGKAAGFGVV